MKKIKLLIVLSALSLYGCSATVDKEHFVNAVKACKSLSSDIKWYHASSFGNDDDVIYCQNGVKLSFKDVNIIVNKDKIK